MPREHPKDRDDLREFEARARSELASILERESVRFPSGSRLLDRYDAAVVRLFDRGWKHFDEVEEVHNELCVAVMVLEDPEPPTLSRMEYEPHIAGCEKRLDFRIDFENGASTWIEVKTIHPKPLDRWDQYQLAIAAGHFPSHARLVLERDWLGGQLFHKYFAARSRMIEYSVETETKVECLPSGRGPVILALFSNGFDWHRDQLEDFLHFYRYGKPFDGDPFGLMQQKFVTGTSIELRGTIDHFAFFKRGPMSVRPAAGSWSVKPVRFSPSRGYF